MSCNQLPENERLPAETLVAWLDGEANAAETAQVTAHLAICEACRREAAALRESGELLARLPSMTPSAGFEARVVMAAERLDGAAQRESATSTAPRGRIRFLTPRFAAAAAAVLVGVTAGAWWITSDKSGADVLTARDEENLAEDLAVISNLDTLQDADAKELAQLADDLDVIDALATDEDG